MQVAVIFINTKWRVIETETGRVCVTVKGNPVDGGGHEKKYLAEEQARKINKYRRQKHQEWLRRQRYSYQS